MDEICLIPARYNSSRFPGKLLALARGKPVLQRTIESALSYFTKEQVFVATDDERIAALSQALNIGVVWTSPSCPTGTDRIAEALLKCPGLSSAKIILNVQADHPCIRAETIKAAIDILKSDPLAAMSTVAAPIRSLEDFYATQIVKVVADEKDNALYFSRSPIPYIKEGLPKKALHHIGLYCFRREFLLEYSQIAPTSLQLMEDLEQLKALEKGWRMKLAIVEDPAIGIDIPADLTKLEKYLFNEDATCPLNTFL